MILLFSCGGRIGNQLFQLSHAIGNRGANEWVISIGFAEIEPLIDGPWRRRWLNVSNRSIRKIFQTFLYPTVYHGLVRTGIASSHYEENSHLVVKNGRLRRLTVMRGYFESSLNQPKDFSKSFRLKESILSKVRPILANLPRGKAPVFVHIRRSDFAELSVALPDRYYQEAVRLFRARHPDTFLIAVGDDPDYAEILLQGIDSKTVSRLSPFEDMALMSLCDGGILSNSTFSWWGAFFGRRRLAYMAPRYWLGWQEKTWDPPEIRASFMTDLVDI